MKDMGATMANIRKRRAGRVDQFGSSTAKDEGEELTLLAEILSIRENQSFLVGLPIRE